MKDLPLYLWCGSGSRVSDGFYAEFLQVHDPTFSVYFAPGFRNANGCDNDKMNAQLANVIKGERLVTLSDSETLARALDIYEKHDISCSPVIQVDLWNLSVIFVG